MEEENKDDKVVYPIKLLLDKSLMQHRDEMMNIFSQILRWLPTTTDTSTLSGHFVGATQFKVQVNFYIPIFEGQVDVDSLEKWINFPEGYFLVYNFSNREKITFALLKVVPHEKYWRETYCEKASIEESKMFVTEPPWASFVDALKGKYYPIRNYEDQYTKWTTLWQERDQVVPKFTNIFHTLCTNLGIRDSEKHMVLKYHGFLQKYIPKLALTTQSPTTT